MSQRDVVNVAQRMTGMASLHPEQVAVAEPLGRDRLGRRVYRTRTFAELEDDTNRIARGMQEAGIRSGCRLVLLVRPGIDFISLVFAMLKAGIVMILIDPGMGKRHLLNCLQAARPEGFVAIPLAQAVRAGLRHRFPLSRHLVTVGRRWFWGGTTLAQLRKASGDPVTISTTREDPAAIIFTTGSTGPPKGVLYCHGNFDRQVTEIRDRYQIAAGEIDVPGFPLFALFNAAMGVTTVIPEMDFTRPARANPRYLIEAIEDWQATQSFGSPALLNVVGKHCETHSIRLPSLRRVLSAGAPVPPHVLRRIKAALPHGGEVHTPYGATEALPVASISATEVIEETARLSIAGAGTCVGRRFAGIAWKVIEIDDGPRPTIDTIRELPTGEIGELMVRGAVVTREYVTRQEANPLHKVQDGDHFWHRMGDVGYLDDQDRFWFCGRKTHRVRTAAGTMFTIPCETVVAAHEKIYRAALVGIGQPGRQVPVMIAEPWPEHYPANRSAARQLIEELRALADRNPLTKAIPHFLLHRGFPVDIRHNSKIFRERLVPWAAKRIV